MPFTVTGASFYDDQSVETNAVGASTVPVASPIDLQFSQNVSTSSLLSYAVSVLRTLADGGSETPVDITLSQQDDSEGNPTIVRVTPTEDLLSTAYYTLYVPKSSYGITSGNGDPLSQSFSFSFQTVVGESVPPEVPIGENVNQLEPIPEELFLLSSSPTTLAVFQYGYGSVIAKFNGRLPADAVVLVTAKHPLGYGLVTSSLWADNMKDPIVIGSEIFLSSEIAASSVDAELLAVAGEDALTADSILVLDTSADPLTL